MLAPVAQRQLPQPTAVEPNPPYRVNDSVECFVEDPNTGRRVWNQAVIREQGTNILAAFVIANEQTGRQVERVRTDVFTTRNRTATNSVRIGDTVMYDEPRVRGIVMDKIYNVSYTNTRGQRLIIEKRTGEIRRPQGQPTQPVAQPAPVAQPQAEAPTYNVGDEVEAFLFGNWTPGTFNGYRNGRLLVRIGIRDTDFNINNVRRVQEQREAVPQPTGVAYEIHNAFDNFKIDDFMGIILMSIGTNSNFRNKTTPLQPLIDNIKANANLSASKKLDLTQKIERIFDKLRQYSNYREKLGNITACIQYVLMQPQDFIDTYIDTFITDCLKAYSSGTTQSCVKGMYERIYFAFRDTVSTICLDQIQGTSAAASPLCKPEYIKIFDCFYENIPTDLLNEYSREWYSERGDEELGKLTPEARIEDFVSFVRSRMNNLVRFGKAEASIRRYANKEINTLFGGRRRSSQRRSSRKLRKTIKRRNRKTNKKRSVKKYKEY
jgi:hypothetical protein